MSFSRREFLTVTGAGVAGAFVAPAASPAALSRHAQAVAASGRLDSSFVFDALSNAPEWTADVFEAARRSGVSVIHTSLSNASFDAAMTAFSRWEDRFERHADRLVRVLRAADIASARQTGRLGVVLGFQNATMLGHDVNNTDRLHARGARCIQLTYNARNLLGDGCTERTNAGLSDFGLDCLRRMNELGIVVDLSHCGEQTTRDAIAFATSPPAFTHTMCKTVHDHVRAKSDDLLKALANKGGVTGIVMLGYFVGPTAETSFEDYLAHVHHAVNVAGVDHVGLATDFSMRGIEATATRETWYEPRLTEFKASYRVRWPPWVKELDSLDRFRHVARGLAKRGYKAGDIDKILGGNWVRYFGDVIES